MTSHRQRIAELSQARDRLTVQLLNMTHGADRHLRYQLLADHYAHVHNDTPQKQADRRTALRQADSEPHLTTGTNSNMNAAKERNFDSPLSRRTATDAKAAAEAKKAARDAEKVRRLIEKKARTPQERAHLERTLGIGKGK